MLFARCLVASFLASTATTQWCVVPTAIAPPASTGAFLAHDIVGARTLLFGGNGSDEFWQWSHGAWTALQPPQRPTPRVRAALAHDPFTGTLLLYGGTTSGVQAAVDETWLWNGTTWQLLPPGVSTPGGLGNHMLTFDGGNQRFVLFGGRANPFFPNQMSSATWLFANGVWTAAAPASTPSARVDAAMAWHPQSGDVVLFGGEDATGAPLDDTWRFDGTTWTQTNQTGLRPSARKGARMVTVWNRGVVAMVGGRDPTTLQIRNDTWEYDGTAWTQVPGVYGGIYPARAEFALTHDVGRNRMVAFGGAIQNGALQDDTWEYGACWQTFGFGCAGTNGVPTLTAGTAPGFGATSDASLSNLVPTIPFGVVAVGLSRTQWALGSLPTLLTGLGMPGCRAYQSSDLLVTVPATAGVATWSWPMPGAVSYLGATFYLQGLSFDPGVNAAWLTTSNALTLVVGY